MDTPELGLLTHISDILLYVLIVNGLVLLVMLGTLIAVYTGYQRLSKQVDDKVAEWEPKLARLEADIQDLKPQILEQLNATKAGIAKATALVEKTEAFWEEVAPTVAEMLDEGRILVTRVRIGVNEFQEQVIPSLRMVAGVTSAVRDGFGMFRQLQSKRAIKGDPGPQGPNR
ncbi:MAG: hypothetical protein ABI743_04810 [bacterium]